MNSRTTTYWARFHDWDTRLCLSLNRASRRVSVREFFGAVSRLGDGVFWYSLMLVLLLVQPAEAALPCIHMLVAGLSGTLVYKLIKRWALRPRPYQVQPAIELGIAPLDQFSFPSGHTLHAVLFTVVALAYYPELAGLLIPFTVLVAASRVVLGLHYPSDVLAGAAIGALMAKLSLLLVANLAL